MVNDMFGITSITLVYDILLLILSAIFLSCVFISFVICVFSSPTDLMVIHSFSIHSFVYSLCPNLNLFFFPLSYWSI